jgi:hypothetical protein
MDTSLGVAQRFDAANGLPEGATKLANGIRAEEWAVQIPLNLLLVLGTNVPRSIG